MKKLIFLIAVVMFIASQSFSQWVVQTIPTSLILYNIHFLNSQTGYIAGSTGTILKTTNGGVNWVIQTTPTTLEVNNIYFLDANTGFAVCGDFSPLNAGTILKTTNGGANWISKFSSNRICLRQAIHFVNSNTGFVGGWSNVDSAVYKTTNGGENWQLANVPTVYGIEKFSFIDANTGWGVGYKGGGGGCVIKTTNSGINWTVIYNTTTVGQLMSLQFVDANTGWVVGISTTNQSLIRKTTNGGFNWVDQINQHPANWELYNIDMINANTGWIVGDASQIVKTTNGGTNWRAQVNPSPGYPLFAVEFNGSDTGWIVGWHGRLYKTVNGGGPVSVQNISTEIPSAYSLGQNYPNPFNSSSKLKFEIGKANANAFAKLGNAKIIVYDLMGREVQTLVNESLQPGTYETTFDGSMLPSGVYFYKLIAGDYTETKRMVLVK
jgi:photosystem II stability/assembly factor-like uncharacterized protein